jgi:hypothetical protein
VVSTGALGASGDLSARQMVLAAPVGP